METGKTPGSRAALSHRAWIWDHKGPYALTQSLGSTQHLCVLWHTAAVARLLTLPEAVILNCFS